MISYRADIDGLRAIAVLLVVFFHASPALAQGGYSGVDVFFVISGYLITAIIMKDIQKNQFSIWNFYERRAKRILPALFAVMTISTIAAYFLLLPIEYEGFGKSLAATSVFSSNFLFWSEAGYFDITSDLKPLLHTWSLAIEEQFYIVFPIYLIIVFKFFRKALIPLTILGLLLSLSVSIWGISTGRDNHVFFLPVTRAWELMIGGVLALNVVPTLRSKSMAQIVGLAGLALILFAGLRQIPSDQFPGANALYPTLGAAFLIYAGMTSPSIITSKILAYPPVKFIGKISYSLYLWHWPALVFAQYYFVTDMTPVQITTTLCGAFVLSVLSWRYIEQPCRKMVLSTPQQKRIFATVIIVLIALFTALGLFIWKQGGAAERFPATVQSFALTEKGGNYMPANIASIPSVNAFLGSTTNLEEVSFAVWGDSHATALSPALDKSAKQNGKTGLFLKEAACMPAFDISEYDTPLSDFCQSFDHAVQDYIRTHDNIQTIFLIARWSAYPRWWAANGELNGDPQSTALFERSMMHTIKTLENLGRRVYIVTEAPHIQGWYVPSVLARSEYFGLDLDLRIPTEKHLAQQSYVHDVFKTLTDKTDLKLIHPYTKLCDDSLCHVAYDGKSLYFDDDHISTYGAQFVAGLFEDAMR